MGTRVTLASTWLSRLRGYIGRPEPKPGEGLLLFRCNAIHTFWMSFALDVLFLDGRGKVLEICQSLRPRRWTRRVPGAWYVLEIPAGTVKASGTKIGDELTWRDPEPYSLSVLAGNRREDRPGSGESRSKSA